MSSSCFPEPPSDCETNGAAAEDQGATAAPGILAVFNNQDTARQMQLTRLSRLMSPHLIDCSTMGLAETNFHCGNLEGGMRAVDNEDQPTAKQKRVARVVMAIAFLLLAMCVALIVVTLSMSDHIDRMVRQALLRSVHKASSRISSSSGQVSTTGRHPIQQQQQWDTASAASVHDN